MAALLQINSCHGASIRIDYASRTDRKGRLVVSIGIDRRNNNSMGAIAGVIASKKHVVRTPGL
jgi:hypothetical protein